LGRIGDLKSKREREFGLVLELFATNWSCMSRLKLGSITVHRAISNGGERRTQAVLVSPVFSWCKRRVLVGNRDGDDGHHSWVPLACDLWYLAEHVSRGHILCIDV